MGAWASRVKLAEPRCGVYLGCMTDQPTLQLCTTDEDNLWRSAFRVLEAK